MSGTLSPSVRLSSRHTRSSPRRHISAQGDPVPPSGHMGRQPRVWRGFLKARRGKRGGKKRGQRGRKKGTYAWKERGGPRRNNSLLQEALAEAAGRRGQHGAQCLA